MPCYALRGGRQDARWPVGVTVDPRGALIVADDLVNTLWRVTRNR
jgi:glucose/arabinose dehydrogenase